MSEQHKPRKWRKSSRSHQNGCCVEWARDGEDVVVRNSRNPNGPVLVFTLKEWEAFIGGAKAGEADLD